MTTQTQMERPEPNTVIAVKRVETVLVEYADERGMRMTTLAVVGDNKVQLLDSQALGFTRARTPVGPASMWMAEGIFKKLGKKE